MIGSGRLRVGISPGTAIGLALAIVSIPAPGAGAHVHGEGRLDVALEDGRIDLFLTAPLGDLRGDGAGDAAALEARFGRADRFALTGAACRLLEHTAELAPVFTATWEDAEPGREGGHEHEDHAEEDHSGHSDGYLSWTYLCDGEPERLRADLFADTTLVRVRVQAISATGVGGATLTAEADDLALP